MELKLTGKRVFVTGASAGIGRAAASLNAAEGVRLALAGRRADALTRIADEIEEAGHARPSVVTGDLTDPDRTREVAIEAADSLGGPIDVLLNNAGAPMPMDDPWDETQWQTDNQLNFAAARQITAAVITNMKSPK